MKSIDEIISIPGREEEPTAVHTSKVPVPDASNDRVRDPYIEKPDSRLEDLSETRSRYLFRDRELHIRRSEAQTLVDVGRFRAIEQDDLVRHAYMKDQERSELDLANLQREGLIKRHTVRYPEAFAVVTLTKKGEAFLRESGWVGAGQEIYSGLVKPKEIRHDVALYRIFQAKAKEIQALGGRVRRVVLDYELKKNIYRQLTKKEKENLEKTDRAKDELGQKHGVPVIQGSFVVPDLRVEYEDQEGNPHRIDIEYVTSSYRYRDLAGKARAGFSLYSPHDQASRFHKIFDDHQIMAEIFSI